MRFMVMVRATKESEDGVMPEREAHHRDGQLQRTDGQGRRPCSKARACSPSSKGARVRFGADGKRSVIDGPFAETKELIAGYWIIQYEVAR